MTQFEIIDCTALDELVAAYSAIISFLKECSDDEQAPVMCVAEGELRMRTKMVVGGRVCHIIMTRRVNDDCPIEYYVRWSDTGECEWLSPAHLLLVS